MCSIICTSFLCEVAGDMCYQGSNNLIVFTNLRLRRFDPSKPCLGGSHSVSLKYGDIGASSFYAITSALFFC